MYWDGLRPECEAAGMRISTYVSEVMICSQKRVDCPLQVGEESQPQLEEFTYIGFLFTSEGKMERTTDRWIGAESAVVWMSVVGQKVLEYKWPK